MGSVQIDTIPSRKRNRFESTANHLLLYVPVAKKRTPNKQGSSEISDTSKVEVSSVETKAGIKKIGVHLQYHKPPEYATLFKDQK